MFGSFLIAFSNLPRAFSYVLFASASTFVRCFGSDAAVASARSLSAFSCSLRPSLYCMPAICSGVMRGAPDMPEPPPMGAGPPPLAHALPAATAQATAPIRIVLRIERPPGGEIDPGGADRVLTRVARVRRYRRGPLNDDARVRPATRSGSAARPRATPATRRTRRRGTGRSGTGPPWRRGRSRPRAGAGGSGCSRGRGCRPRSWRDGVGALGLVRQLVEIAVDPFGAREDVVPRAQVPGRLEEMAPLALFVLKVVPAAGGRGGDEAVAPAPLPRDRGGRARLVALLERLRVLAPAGRDLNRQPGDRPHRDPPGVRVERALVDVPAVLVRLGAVEERRI